MLTLAEQLVRRATITCLCNFIFSF